MTYCPEFIDGTLGVSASQVNSANKKCKIAYVIGGKIERFRNRNSIGEKVKKHRLSCFACVALTLAMIGYPTISKADILYSTIDMPCDTSSNTVNIKAGFASEKMWSTRSEHPRSGLYFLDDLVSSSDVSTPSKPITCTTANGQTIGFAAYHGDEPKHDSLVMFCEWRTFANVKL